MPVKRGPEFVILKETAWLPATQWSDRILGHIIRYPLKPTDDYVPPSPMQFDSEDVHEDMLKDFMFSNTIEDSHKVSMALKSVAGFNFTGNTEEAVHLAGKLVRFKRLTQHSRFWKKLRTDGNVADEVPGWVSWLNTWPPCLVVGIMTAQDVDINFSHSESHERSGGIELPLTTVALDVAGMPLLPGLAPGMGDLNVGVEKKNKVAQVFKAKAPNERIFALELRIVTTALIRRRELALKEKGPKFNPGWLAGAGNGDDSEDDETPGVEDLILEDFTENEYELMCG